MTNLSQINPESNKKLLLAALLLPFLCASCSNDDDCAAASCRGVTASGILNIRELILMPTDDKPVTETLILSGMICMRDNYTFTVLQEKPLPANGTLSLDCSAIERRLTMCTADKMFPRLTVSDPTVKMGSLHIAFYSDEITPPQFCRFSDETGEMYATVVSTDLIYATGAVRVSGNDPKSEIAYNLNLSKGWNMLMMHDERGSIGLVTANGRWILKH